MRLGPKVYVFAALLIAAGLSVFGAQLAADAIEERSFGAVRTALIEAGHDWAEIHTDGLQVHLGGEAASEAVRFNALSIAGRVVDSSRVIDGTTVRAAQPLAPPRFSLEVLRNEDGISLIGLVPASVDVDAMIEEIARVAEGANVTNFVETASYPVPAGWVEALDFGIDALAELPRSKISIAAGEVAVTAIGASLAEKRRKETALAQRAPDAVRLKLRISAPRPVITPFVLRFQITESGPRLDACSASDEQRRDRILAAAHAAGLEGRAVCNIGLGVPTPDWPEAVEMTLAALAEIGAGSVTFTDADIALVAAETTAPDVFDRVVGGLESNLPDVFSLSSVLLQPEDDTGEDLPPELIATRSPEGAVEVQGRLNNEVVRATVESFARARFGVDNVYMAARLDASLPEDWPVRALAGLRALSTLDHGTVRVLADMVEVEGATGNEEARTEISGLLSQRLGETARYELDISYDIALDPMAALPTPEDCVERITLIQEDRKITFGPGSTVVEGDSAAIVDQIAEVLRACRQVDMQIEIAGHTDSQGRETMNLDLSEARAKAVLDALVERRILSSRLSSKGYGETRPIADNETEAGREANRRIEFRLIVPGSDDTADAGAEETESE